MNMENRAKELFPKSLLELYRKPVKVDRDKYVIGISDLVKCSIKAYIKATMRIREKPTAFTLAGEYIHKIIQSHFLREVKDAKVEVDVKKELTKNWELWGLSDIVLPNKVIEIKTVNDISNLTEETLKRYFMQANFYARMLNIDNIEILIVEIPTGNTESLLMYSSDHLFNKTVNYALELTEKKFSIEVADKRYCNICVCRSYCKR